MLYCSNEMTRTPPPAPRQPSYQRRVLDVLSGTGGVSLQLSQQFEQVVGVEPDRDLLQVAQQLRQFGHAVFSFSEEGGTAALPLIAKAAASTVGPIGGLCFLSAVGNMLSAGIFALSGLWTANMTFLIHGLVITWFRYLQERMCSTDAYLITYLTTRRVLKPQ